MSLLGPQACPLGIRTSAVGGGVFVPTVGSRGPFRDLVLALCVLGHPSKSGGIRGVGSVSQGAAPGVEAPPRLPNPAPQPSPDHPQHRPQSLGTAHRPQTCPCAQSLCWQSGRQGQWSQWGQQTGLTQEPAPASPPPKAPLFSSWVPDSSCDLRDHPQPLSPTPGRGPSPQGPSGRGQTLVLQAPGRSPLCPTPWDTGTDPALSGRCPGGGRPTWPIRFSPWRGDSVLPLSPADGDEPHPGRGDVESRSRSAWPMLASSRPGSSWWSP